MSQQPSERLTLPPQVVTGEAVALELRPASFATRCLALALDLLILFAVGIAVLVVLGLTLPELDEAAASAVGIVAFVGVLLGLPVAVETLTRGRGAPGGGLGGGARRAPPPRHRTPARAAAGPRTAARGPPRRPRPGADSTAARRRPGPRSPLRAST